MRTQLDVLATQYDHATSKQPYFAYRRVMYLRETNATGNVYFSQYVKWQGHCREILLKLTGQL